MLYRLILFFIFVPLLYGKHFSVSYDPDYAPFSYAIESKPYGLLIDIWKLWAKKNHHTLTFIEAKNWDDAIKMAKEKNVDFFLGTTPYEQWMYGSDTYYKTKTAFFFLRDSKNTLEKIGIIGTDYEDILKQKLPHATIFSFDTYEQLINALLHKKVDTIYDDTLAISYFAIKHGYAHLLSHSEILSEISNVKAISATKTNADIFSQGFQQLKLKELEAIEANWIEDEHARYYNNANFLKQKIYHFQFNSHNKPLEFINENGVYSGVIADMLSLISTKSGLVFKPIRSKDDKIEMISATEAVSSLQEHYNLTNKDIYTLNAVLVANNTQNVPTDKDLNNVSIGVLDNQSPLLLWLKQHYTHANIITFSSFKEMLEALHRSQIDLLATNSIKAIYTINTNEKDIYKIIRILPYQFHLKIAFAKSVQKEVLALVDETLSLITAKEKSDIYHKWSTIVIKKEIDWKLIFTILGIAVSIVSFFIFVNKRLNTLVQKRTAELKELNENLELKVQQRTKELAEINKKMQDNIRYASFIQNAILPSAQEFSRFFDDYFIYWEPKDIVGGDIYFFESPNENEAYLFVIDCTGHGVSGAFLTMLVKAIEEQIVSTLSHTKHTPASILQDINTILKKLLPQEDSQTNVGLDAGIIYINKAKKQLQYAGANIPLYYIKEDQLYTLKPNRVSIGYTKSKKHYDFTEHTINYDQESRFYITTDGFIDQNGGNKEFPFGKKRFFTLLQKHYRQPMKKQQEIYKKELLIYQKDQERNDDITVIGFHL